MLSQHGYRLVRHALLPFQPSILRSCAIGCSLGLGSPAARASSSASSTRWKTRQGKDHYAREAKVQGLKSRAAFKLLQMNDKYGIFKKGITVVDLGYAPGSWSHVAVNRTAPHGRVIGVDIIPAQPPKGVSTIQGNFLSPDIQAEVRSFLSDPQRGRPRRRTIFASEDDAQAEAEAEDENVTQEELDAQQRGYIDMERRASEQDGGAATADAGDEGALSKRERDELRGRVVDVVLSDMSEPWDQTGGFWKRSVSDPYFRMMNTSGTPFRDHAGSMDLCNAALSFCFDTLRTGGHFVCKFYQGSEERLLEARLKRLFDKVHREKPEASRKESKEQYFVALRRKDGLDKEAVFAE